MPIAASPPDDLIRAVAAMGYDGIELADEALWPAIAEAGLAIVSHRGHGTIESGLNRRENHDRIEAEILSNLELARRWNIPLLICFSGSREGLADEAGIENTALGLSRVAESGGATPASPWCWSCSIARSITRTISATTPPGGWRSSSALARPGCGSSTISITCRSWRVISSAPSRPTTRLRPLPRRGEPRPARTRPLPGDLLPGDLRGDCGHWFRRIRGDGVPPARWIGGVVAGHAG